jgi:hypothetical protein
MLPKERGRKMNRIQRGNVFILLAAVVFMLRFTEIESSRYSRFANSVIRSLLFMSPESCIDATERRRFPNFVGMHVNGSEF